MANGGENMALGCGDARISREPPWNTRHTRSPRFVRVMESRSVRISLMKKRSTPSGGLSHPLHRREAYGAICEGDGGRVRTPAVDKTGDDRPTSDGEKVDELPNGVMKRT